MLSGEKGFTIIEIVIGVSIFLLGMLGIAALEISSIRAEAFSMRLTEANQLARGIFEELMSSPYSDSRLDATVYSIANGNVADFNESNHNAADYGRNNIDPTDATKVEHDLGNFGTNDKFRVFYNVCEDCLIEKCKTVRVFVRWTEKDQSQTIDYYGLIPRS